MGSRLFCLQFGRNHTYPFGHCDNSNFTENYPREQNYLDEWKGICKIIYVLDIKLQ